MFRCDPERMRILVVEDEHKLASVLKRGLEEHRYAVDVANRVLTRTQIAEHVWDYDFVSMSNVIDVYVGYLRRKLADDGEARLLRTIRGTGYQLKAS